MLDEYMTTQELSGTDIFSLPPYGNLSLRKQIAIKTWKRTRHIKNLNICIACFCNDGDLLSQWRAYTGGSYGFAIGFRTDWLRKYANAANFNLRRVIYDKDVQQKIIREFSSYYLQEQIIKENPQEEIIESLLDAVSSCGVLFKNGHFSEEKEWRLISPPIHNRELQFRQGRSMIITYCELSFDGSTLDVPIDHVIVGPCPHMELSVNSVEMLLMREKIGEQMVTPPGVAAKVVASKIPYRDTV